MAENLWNQFWLPIVFLGLLIAIVLFVSWLLLSQGKKEQSSNICVQDIDCDGGRVCDNRQCLEPLGSRCSSVADCSSRANLCLSGSCVEASYQDKGQQCTGTVDAPLEAYGSLLCKSGLVCSESVCKAQADQPCSKNDDCLSQFCVRGYCSRYSGKAGAPCSKKSLCQEGYICDQGTCKGKEGSLCQSNFECLSGLSCEDGICRVSSEGSVCLSNKDCGSGECVTNVVPSVNISGALWITFRPCMDSYIVYILTSQGIYRSCSSSFQFFSLPSKPSIREIHSTSSGLYGIGRDGRLYIAEIAGKYSWAWTSVESIAGSIDSGDTAQKGSVLYLQRKREVTRYFATSEGLSKDSIMTVGKGRFYISPNEKKYALLYRQRARVFNGEQSVKDKVTAMDFDSQDMLVTRSLPRFLQLFLSPTDKEYAILTGICKEE